MTGIVQSFNDQKGYGFLKPLIGKPDTVEPVFFHQSQFAMKNGRRPIPPVGAEVRFDLCRSDRGNGQQAVNIELITQRLKAKPPAVTGAASSGLVAPGPPHRFPE